MHNVTQAHGARISNYRLPGGSRRNIRSRQFHRIASISGALLSHEHDRFEKLDIGGAMPVSLIRGGGGLAAAKTERKKTEINAKALTQRTRRAQRPQRKGWQKRTENARSKN